ncbi:MAG TPA: methyltransferase, partial [Paracoccaceae bacterium]|nr:methyltransferase [Paracoccaceae bacterium]
IREPDAWSAIRLTLLTAAHLLLAAGLLSLLLLHLLNLLAEFFGFLTQGLLLPAPVDGLLLALVLVLRELLLAAREFRRARTSIVPRETPAALLTAGPYALGRNPIYLADALILAGLVLRWDLAALPLVPAFVAVLTRRFIRGEEALCEATFGASWAAYARRTRRWL